MIQMLFCTWIRGLIYSTLQFFQLSCSYGLPGIFACLKVCQSLSLSCCFQFHLLLLESIKFQIWNEKILLVLLLSLSLNLKSSISLLSPSQLFLGGVHLGYFCEFYSPGEAKGKLDAFFLNSTRKRPTFSSLSF